VKIKAFSIINCKKKKKIGNYIIPCKILAFLRALFIRP
jgi:hypothetical protein